MTRCRSNDRLAGIVATIVRVDTDPRRVETVTLTGGAGDATTELVQRLGGVEGDWRIRTISTPSTILRDLQGTRLAARTTKADVMDLPENTYLGRLGRLDLLEQP